MCGVRFCSAMGAAKATAPPTQRQHAREAPMTVKRRLLGAFMGVPKPSSRDPEQRQRGAASPCARPGAERPTTPAASPTGSTRRSRHPTRRQDATIGRGAPPARSSRPALAARPPHSRARRQVGPAARASWCHHHATVMFVGLVDTLSRNRSPRTSASRCWIASPSCGPGAGTSPRSCAWSPRATRRRGRPVSWSPRACAASSRP